MELKIGKKHKSFCSNEKRMRLTFNPHTVEMKDRALPGLTPKEQNFHIKLAKTQQVFFKMENEPTLNGIFRNFAKKASLKLKLFRYKKRKVSGCNLGIGYQCENHQPGTEKIAQDFFPQRSLSLFKKIAFRNSTMNLANQNSIKERESQRKTENQKVHLRLRRQKTSNESRSQHPSIQLKIKTLCNRSYSRGQSLDETNLQCHRKIKQKPLFRLRPETNDPFPRESMIKQQILSPWGFYEHDAEEMDNDNIVIRRA